MLSTARSFAVYDEVTRLGDWFAAELAELVERERDEWRADVVVPVPLHRDRQRERGYNQGELIARPRPRPPQLVLSRTEPGNRYVAPTPPGRGSRLTTSASCW